MIERQIRTTVPDIIYTHFPGDMNNDHAIVFKAVQIATRPVFDCRDWKVKEVLLMEVPSSTEWGFYNQFSPDVYIDVSQTIMRKIRAMNEYIGEKRLYPHPRSCEAIENLAKKRGAEVYIQYAESFKLLRKIQ
jgi:LmbE family N-acetylglucosaminyl deacetylase